MRDDDDYYGPNDADVCVSAPTSAPDETSQVVGQLERQAGRDRMVRMWRAALGAIGDVVQAHQEGKDEPLAAIEARDSEPDPVESKRPAPRSWRPRRATHVN
jgi:hypothetical protein